MCKKNIFLFIEIEMLQKKLQRILEYTVDTDADMNSNGHIYLAHDQFYC